MQTLMNKHNVADASVELDYIIYK